MSWLERIFRRPRERGIDYEQALIGAQMQAATATPLSTVLAAIEAPIGVLARAFASAEVEADPWAQSLLSPAFLSDAVRHVLRRGEHVSAIEGPGDSPRLSSASDWDVQGGGHDPAGWQYRVTLAGPHTTSSRTLSGAGVVHLTYATSPREPWRGRGPLALSKATAALAGEIERALAEEARSPTASIVPVSEGLDAEGLKALRTDIAKARGGALTPETRGGGGMGGDRAEYRPHKLQAAPAESLVTLREHVCRELAAAMGIAPELLSGESEGTGRRESWRQCLHGTLVPLARRFEWELSAKLDTPIRLSFDRLFASDIQGRLRSWRSAVGPHVFMSPVLAARICGIEATAADFTIAQPGGGGDAD